MFNVEVERELAAIHRHLSRRKEVVLKVLSNGEDECSVSTAADLVGVLEQLDEIRLRLQSMPEEEGEKVN